MFNAQISFDASASEVIISPWFESHGELPTELPLELTPVDGVNFRRINTWDNTAIAWSEVQNFDGKSANIGSIIHSLGRAYPTYDQFLVCASVPKNVSLHVSLFQNKVWSEEVSAQGNGRRIEIILPLQGDQILESVKIRLSSYSNGSQQVGLRWCAVVDSKAKESQRKKRPLADPTWPRLVVPQHERKSPQFARGLLFSHEDLPKLRERRRHPMFKAHWEMLYSQAHKIAKRPPEDRISAGIPWSDGRYQRSYEVENETFFHDPLCVAVVGLVEEDPFLLDWAIRALMAMVHTQYWSTPEERLIGSTWTQRCFLPEMATSTASLLYDWLSSYLTQPGRTLVLRTLWNKGLAQIEADLMEYEYVWHMNQGPWFCRARIFAGLLLEQAWPRTNGYVDKAASEMREMLGNYVMADGGVDEGLGYFIMTFGTVLPGAFAWARARGKDVKELLPKAMANSGDYLASMSAMRNGEVIMEGDSSAPVVVGDAVALLAKIYPGSQWEKLLPSVLGKAKPDIYFSQYLPHGELSYILAPDTTQAAQCLVPTFSILPMSGHLTSKREFGNGSVRLHLVGAKAYAGHTHQDKGGIILELDGEPLLIDRGITRYDDTNSVELKRSRVHNVLTPIAEDGSFPDQESLTKAIIPQGIGDQNMLLARIDIGHVWQKWMTSCQRNIDSSSPHLILIHDNATLIKNGPVALHFQSYKPFEISGTTARLDRMTISMPWAEKLECVQDLYDNAFRPVYRLTARSCQGIEFSLDTRIEIQL